jgi:hypothetical protein
MKHCKMRKKRCEGVSDIRQLFLINLQYALAIANAARYAWMLRP